MSMILQKSNSLYMFSQLNAGSPSPRTSELPSQEDSNSNSNNPTALTAKTLPSWASDWFSKSFFGEARYVADAFDFRIARELMFPKYCDGRYQSGCSIHVDQDHILHLSGIRIDEVEEIIISQLPSRVPEIPYLAAGYMLIRYDIWARVHGQQIDHRAKYRIIISTLISDCIPDADSSPPFRRATTDDIDTLYEWYSTTVSATLPTTQNIDPVLLDHMMMMNLCDKAIFITHEKGYLGLTHASPQEGDIVFLLAGGTHPVILRPVPNENGSDCHYWTVVGECSGIFGLNYDNLADEGLVWEDVNII
ncbi:MAG: hypothetical protein L6R42_002637 [Xanthoria sp. 1 TBL-2021]|nr:MAG: hypothetical protein L6R42_002637 [Xanthoria sp. 1 TBL-2021]